MADHAVVVEIRSADRTPSAKDDREIVAVHHRIAGQITRAEQLIAWARRILLGLMDAECVPHDRAAVRTHLADGGAARWGVAPRAVVRRAALRFGGTDFGTREAVLVGECHAEHIPRDHAAGGVDRAHCVTAACVIAEGIAMDRAAGARGKRAAPLALVTDFECLDGAAIVPPDQAAERVQRAYRCAAAEVVTERTRVRYAATAGFCRAALPMGRRSDKAGEQDRGAVSDDVPERPST